MTGHFSQQALEQVAALFAEGQVNPLEGECQQKQKREQKREQRTPAEMQADKARAQESRGKDVVPSATRSAAAKKAAETRRRCQGLPSRAETGVKP